MAIEQLTSVARDFAFKPQPKVAGRLTRVVGLTIEAEGLCAAVGSRCLIVHPDHEPVEAEVVGFAAAKTFLVTLTGQEQLRPGAAVYAQQSSNSIAVGDELLGRVIDGLGQPLDGKGELRCSASTSYLAPRLNPMLRQPITEPLDVGVRAINALLSLGRGQRIGLFAGSGVGKSMLLGMMTRHTAADVVVVGMIGERGREVREFIEQNLGPQGSERAIVVASPADDAPLLRLRAAHMATRIAEHYRDQGQHVLLLMDSLSRFAQAQREIALAAGEPPAVRGYPASVFAKIPALVERAGNAIAGDGSLTAIYTVLAEGDDLQDPVADAVRAILDGHIVLSRALADAGQYPAIDIEASISRVMTQIAQAEHLQRAQQFKRLNARYSQVQDLLAVGAYRAGVDSETDAAIHYRQAMQAFMRQGLTESVSFAAAQQALNSLFTENSSGNEHSEAYQSVANSAATGSGR